MDTANTYATVIADIRTALEAGNPNAARRFARRYVGGADPELAQGLVDEVTEKLAAETAAYADRLAEQHRTRARAEIAQPAAPVTRRRGQTAPVRTAPAAAEVRITERDADAYTDQRTDTPTDQRERDTDTRSTEHDYTNGATNERNTAYRFNRDTGAEAALRPAQGRPCFMLGCGIERTRADHSNPDGLCTDCRDAGITRTDAINARCAQQAETARAHGRNPLDILRETYKRIGDGADQRTRQAAARDRDAITAWVAANLTAELAADSVDPARIAKAARAHDLDIRAALDNAWRAAAAKGRARISQWVQENPAELAPEMAIA